MIYVTRKEHFNAAHKIYNEAWSEEKNKQIFGKCANKNWHGHNYSLYVTVCGEVDPETGFVVNLKDLSDIIRDHIIELLDHKNLNLDVEGMHPMPSTEYLTIFIWNTLNPLITNLGTILHCVKLYETENNYVEYFGK